MSRSVRKVGHRVLSGLLSVICLFSLVLSSVPSAFAAEEPPENNIRLVFADSDGATISEDGTHADYEVGGKTQIVEIQVQVNINYAVEKDKLTIRIPLVAFKDRDGNPAYKANAAALQLLITQMSTEAWTIVNYHENASAYITDGYLELSNKYVSSYQGTFSLQYDVDAFTIEDKADQSFGIEVEDETGSFKKPNDLTASFDTHVDYGWLSKKASDTFAPQGSYYEWHDSLEDRFPGTFESADDFNAQCEDNYFICYQITPEGINTNQKCTFYIDEKPQFGEVIAVSRIKGTLMSGGTPLVKETTGEYAGQWKYEDWRGETPTPSFFALAKYPKNPQGGSYETDGNGDAVFKNEVTLTLVGVDHPDAPDTSSHSRSMTSIFQDAAAGTPGDIWGVGKKGYSDPMGALNILRNGRDVTFSYDVTGTGLTYKYVLNMNRDFDDANRNNYKNHGGPYRLEVVDDAMYVNGLGEDGLTTARLDETDFHFKTFTMTVEHEVVEEVDLNGTVREKHSMPFEEREKVQVWVMTQESPDEWVFDQELENTAYIRNDKPSDSVYAHGDNQDVFEFARADEGIYRVKFVYNNANGDVTLRSTLTGVLRSQGNTVQRVLSNIEDKNIANFQLFNWDAEMGYNGNGKWEDPIGSDSIKEPTPEDMKSDLLALDEQLYKQYGHGENSIAHRQVANNNLSEAHFFSGAGKQKENNKWGDNATLDLSYYIAAVEGAGAATIDNLEEMVDIGALQTPQKIVFHELMPVGVRFASAEAITLRGASGNPNFVVFNSGEYTWDDRFATQFQGAIQSQNTAEEATEISWETKDVYLSDGTIRQMATITVEFSEDVLPIVQLGLGSPYGITYGLGTVLRVNTVARAVDINGTLDNNFAAHFVDKNGKTLELEGSGVFPDDGSIYEDIKTPDEENVFKDTDNDNDTDSRTVVGADHSYTETMRYTGTQLIKWVREDKLDTYYKYHTQTYAGHDYTYKIQFFTNNGTVRNVVIYDSIEQAFGYDADNSDEHPQKYEDERHWKGTLRGIDLTEAEHAGYDEIQVYVNKDKFYTDAEFATNLYEDYPGLVPQDLIDGKDGWEKVARDEYDTYDWENVKSIAFSIGAKTYFGEDYSDENGEHIDLPNSVSVYLKMTAPDSIHKDQTADGQVLAYNNPAYYSEKLTTGGAWSKATTVANTVTIGMKSAQADIPAITKSYTGNDLYEGFEETCVFEITPIGDTKTPRKYIDNKGAADKVMGEWGDVIDSVSVTLTDKKPTATTESIGLYFTEPGVYEYEISERADSYAGVTYSAAKYKIVFTVTDEREIDGETPQYAENTELDVDIKIYKTHNDDGTKLDTPLEVTAIEFNNDYTPDSVDVDMPVVEKTINGDVPEGNDKTFTFEVKAAQGEPEGIPMPEKTTATVTGSGKATSFGKITYTKAGVYNYDIFEQDLDGSCVGYTKDNTVYKMTVTVKDMGGELSATSVIKKGDAQVSKLEFVNTYAPKPASAKLEVEKTVKGEAPKAKETYKFTLKGLDGAPVPKSTTATVTGSGTAVFSSWTYTKAGVYVYEVSETKGSSDRCEYDKTVFTVTDTVTDNDGVLEVSRVITNEEDEQVEKIEFVNTYFIKTVDAQIEIEKRVDGEAPSNDETYTFSLEGVDGAPVPENTQVTITGSGKATFGSWTYTQAGVYVYKVSELAGDSDRCDYDSTVFLVTDTVTNNDGVLEISRVITAGEDEQVEKIEFVNDYYINPIYAELEIEKTVKGEAPKKEETYKFTIKGFDGAPVPETTQVTITGSGKASFGSWSYTQAGVYIYEVTEIAGDSDRCEYDSTVYVVTDTVINNDGVLEASRVITVADSEVEKIEFVNTYFIKSVSTELEIEKKVQGAAPEKDETYTFTIKGLDGAPVPENVQVTITGSGRATFGSWTYTEAGVYVYEVTELAGDSDRCEYDGTVYVVTDTVTNNDGVLEISRVITVADSETESIVFVNTYSEEEDNGPDNPTTGARRSVGFTAILLGAVVCMAVKRKNEE